VRGVIVVGVTKSQGGACLIALAMPLLMLLVPAGAVRTEGTAVDAKPAEFSKCPTARWLALTSDQAQLLEAGVCFPTGLT
jgi:hypothetical protein